jgi:hypothetical protein
MLGLPRKAATGARRAAALAVLPLGLAGGCAGGDWLPPDARGWPWFPSSGAEVPPGQLPPPGECRVWFPGRPPGQQPPPGPCRELRRRVPDDAVLVRG